MSLRLPLFALALILPLAACDSGAGEGAQQQGELAGGKPSLGAGTPEAEVGEVDYSQAGTELPQLTFADPAGAELDFASLEGQPVLLNLWATWCAPCVVEMPTLDNLAEQMGDDLRVITVSQDMRGAELVEPFLARHGYANLEPWLDTKGTLDRALDNGGVLPLTILFDGEGRELLRVKGGYHWDSEDAIALVSEALASRQSTE
ncbi:MAG: TlpA disulfide reductase family protein [Pseudomonadota bacterium]